MNEWLPREQWSIRDGQLSGYCKFCDKQLAGTLICNGYNQQWNHFTCCEEAYEAYRLGTPEQGVQRAMVLAVQAHEGEWLLVRKIPGASRSARYEWRKPE